jgi:hypothetical protein
MLKRQHRLAVQFLAIKVKIPEGKKFFIHFKRFKTFCKDPLHKDEKPQKRILTRMGDWK